MTPAARDSSLRALLARLPKIDLHRHLEGSLRLTALQHVALDHGLDLPAGDIKALRPHVQVTPGNANFRSFLELCKLPPTAASGASSPSTWPATRSTAPRSP